MTEQVTAQEVADAVHRTLATESRDLVVSRVAAVLERLGFKAPFRSGRPATGSPAAPKPPESRLRQMRRRGALAAERGEAPPPELREPEVAVAAPPPEQPEQPEDRPRRRSRRRREGSDAE